MTQKGALSFVIRRRFIPFVFASILMVAAVAGGTVFALSSQVATEPAPTTEVALPGPTPESSVPSLMNFQGRLTNAQGQPINGNVQVTFNLYDSQAGGIPVWSETQTLTAQDGLFDALLGSGVTPLDGTVFKFNTERWLGVQVASDPEMTPRMRISTVPYSFTAQQALKATDLVCLGCVVTGHLAVGAVDSGALADGGVQSQDVAFSYAASDAKAGKASDADKLDGLDSTAFALAGAAQTGSAAGDLLLYQRPFTINTVDWGPSGGILGADVAGTHTSIAIGIDGLPIIAYQESSADLKVAHCNDPACSSATFSELDFGSTLGTSHAGRYSSIAIGQDGKPIISYHKKTGIFPSVGRMMLAFCEDIACTSATITSVDTGSSSTGLYTSVAILGSGNPVVSYYDAGDLRIAYCGGDFCTSPTVTTVDSVGDVGKHTSIAIGVTGRPVISYYDDTNGDLKWARCESPLACSSPTIRTLDSDGDVGQYTSIAIDWVGDPIISYYKSLGFQSALKITHCADPDCTPNAQVTTRRVDVGGDVGLYSSITATADTLPLVSHYNGSNGNLRITRGSDLACLNTPTTSIVDRSGDVGKYSSITIGEDGLPVISYFQDTTNDLKVLHCARAKCEVP